MTTFEARVVRDARVCVERIEASDAAHARARLVDDDCQVVSIRRAGRALTMPSRSPRFDVPLFAYELGALLDAGLTVVEAIEALREKAARAADGRIFGNLLNAMYDGLPCSVALARLPSTFPPLFVASVAASEHTGHLAAALLRYRQYEQHVETLRKRLQAAMTYPAIVIAAGAAILVFLLFYVVPRFAAVLQSAPHLPATGRLLVGWGALVDAHRSALLMGLGLMATALVYAGRSPDVRSRLMAAMWRLPRLREHHERFVLTRFYRTLGMLLGGGMPAVDAIALASGLLPASYAHASVGALAQIRAGMPMSDAFLAHGLTTAVAVRLLRVAERGGGIDTMCERIAQFHDASLARALDTFSRVFEPVLMLIVGGVIGLVVFLLYMPIFELAGSLQG
ncbi:Type II secretion system protein F [Pandoraea morbifera]|uniref:General secretion pathway protein F n=1 Tax=Pandoraea morbifera TaxID=2508300 RepID=A0A5E4TDF1_9BURK|nr:type II secretion system F family protein [Pandoraea morbifera]VVD84973.1 Type II secretion system protein F [Pandoraea morbifera]